MAYNDTTVHSNVPVGRSHACMKICLQNATKGAPLHEQKEPDAKGGNSMEFREKKRWGFFGLPFTFTTYMVTEELITVEEGFINKRENDCYIYKVQDVELIRTLGERMFGLGTVKCYTGDTTNPELYLTHIKNAKNIKNFILEASEKARLKRRTMNMLDIGADADIPEEN